MRAVLRIAAILLVVLAMIPMAQAGSAMAEPELLNTGVELVIITNIGQLEVRDPYTPPGFQPVVWQSPETGFTDVATGDFNGDGTDEIVGLRGGEARVYDPVLQPGEADTAFVFFATAGQVWRNVTTGDLDGDGRDELILAQTSGSGTQMYAYKFVTGTGWTQIFTNFYGAPWVDLATGDVMGNGRDQVVGIRNVGSNCQIITFNPMSGWQTINEFTRSFPWVGLAVGDVTLDSGGRDEIVVTRTDVGADLQSMLVFRWEGSPTELAQQEGEVFNPNFSWIALADVNGSGDKEVFLLRNNPGAGQAALASRNYGFDQGTPVFNELLGQTQWNGIQAGDVDGDGKDEVIVMSPSAYIIYNQPDANTSSTTYPGAYSSTGNFAVGNFDGPGIPTGPALAVTPLDVTLSLQVGQNASQIVNITNTGTDALNWTATVVDGTGWLSMSPSAGTAPSTPQLLVSTGGVAPGQYVGRIRIDAVGAADSPQTITVNLTVTAPQFAVQPGRVSWLYQPPVNPGVRTVTISGQNVSWHAGVVPTSVAAQIEQALAAGEPVMLQEGRLVIGSGPIGEEVPIVDWIDVNPVSGVATAGGILVDLSLVLDRVDYGFRTAAVVFVADTVASPPAVVVRASVLRSLPDASDLRFLPMIVQGQ